MKCRRCNKEFIADRPVRAYCSRKCYNQRNKIDLGQVVFDSMALMVPICILAFAVFYITPKDVNMVTDDEIEILTNIPMSSCDDLWEDEEDEKWIENLSTKSKKK